jgi:2-polyprenyl-3-methyl-5-hydroxy-6-metoxy-1,4-benzoquinol methylase
MNQFALSARLPKERGCTVQKRDKPQITWTESFLDIVLRFVPLEVTSVLDVGCGRGIVGALTRIYRDPPKLVGLDFYDPYITFCRNLGIYSKIVKHNLQVFPYPFYRDEFDIVIGLEVIEHLPKPLSSMMLCELERIARRVIISTPNVFFKQPLHDGNPFQNHLSRWSVQDFKARGYSVFGVGSLKIAGIHGRARALCYALGRFTFILPSLANSLLAIKDRPPKRLLEYVKEQANMP